MIKRKRKIKYIRICMVLLMAIVISYGVYEFALTYIAYHHVLPTDSEKYVIAKSGIPIELVEVTEKNPELRKFVSEYPEKKDKKIDIDIRKDMKKGEVPMFMQWDERWGYATYGDNLMGLSGCGPTVLSMVLVYLQNDDRWNPYEVAKYAQEHNYYQDGVGSKWTLMSEGAQELGVKVENLTLDEEYIMQVLRLGNPIICSVGPGDFTTTGHFIVLTGVTTDGRIRLHDPNRMSTTNKTWDYATLKKQIVGLWAYYL